MNMHVGCMGLAPGSRSFVDSIPPLPTGGNLDNRRIGKGTIMYYPVEVARGLLSMGDAHAAQGDSELDGTGIETSITGKFKISLIKVADFDDAMKVQDFPLGETDTEWIVHVSRNLGLVRLRCKMVTCMKSILQSKLTIHSFCISSFL
jgi:acetamidase/formamidase